jgi:GNAT superfamily N-acetyltransferase
VCPLADASLIEILGKRGYRISHFENTLARTLSAETLLAAPETRVQARRAQPPEREAWSRVISMGFSEGVEPPRESLDLFGLFFDNPSGTAWIAEDAAGQVIGGAGMGIHEGAAMLFGDATLPEARGRGAQAALIHARLLYALERGCDLAMACTLPGSVSQRNYERFGLRVAYTKALMIREWSA